MTARTDNPEELETIAATDLELPDDDAENVAGGGDIVITKTVDKSSPVLYQATAPPPATK